MEFNDVETSITIGSMLHTAMSFIALNAKTILLTLAVLYVPVIIGMVFILMEKPAKAINGKGKKTSGTGRKRSSSGTGKRTGSGGKRATSGSGTRRKSSGGRKRTSSRPKVAAAR